MLEIINDGILLPEINRKSNWNLKDFEQTSKLITYIHSEDVKNNDVHQRRPGWAESKNADVWSTKRSGTIADYLYALEGIGSSAVMSLNHVFWFVDNHSELLNTAEKNTKGDYIGNFFFVPKNEFQTENNVWNGEIVTASVIRRNMDELQFGIRFYPIDTPTTFSAENRRIISIS